MPGKLRAVGAVTPPIDQDWVRGGLTALGTGCEWEHCLLPALFAFEGLRTLAYLCESHFKLVKINHRAAMNLDAHRWNCFREGFDFIRQVEVTGGDLLQQLDDRDAAIEAARKDVEKKQRTLVNQAVRVLREQEVKVGSPDDELASARGVQSPSREELQLIFRVPEQEPPDPVILTQQSEASLIMMALI